MTPRAGAGVVLVALHAIALPGLLERAARPELSVTVAAVAPVAPDGVLPDDGHLPPEAAARATLRVDGKPAAPAAGTRVAPGLRRQEWEVTYRGGFVRRVGRTVLAGPLQDPEGAPSCGLRLHVGQRLLDDLRPLLIERLEYGLEGRLGFRRVEKLTLEWSERHAGSLVVSIVLRFSRGAVPVEAAIIPRLEGGVLTVDTRVRASVVFSSTVVRHVVDLVGQTGRLDRMATEIAQSEVDKAVRPLAAVFAAPPPVPLGQGHALPLRYCPSEPLRIWARGRATIPLALALAGAPGGVRPVHLATAGGPGAPPADAPLALDLDLDAVNGVLYHAWSVGYLDLLIEQAGWHTWFNEQPLVEELLTLRVLGAPRLTLPPTVEPAGDGDRPFTLGAEAAILLGDGGLTTPARLFGRIELDVVTDAASGRLAADVAFADLALSCEPRPGTLAPCYASLVDEARGGTAELHGPIARHVAAWFDALVLGRHLGGGAGGMTFVIDSARVGTVREGGSGWVRVALAGSLEE